MAIEQQVSHQNHLDFRTSLPPAGNRTSALLIDQQPTESHSTFLYSSQLTENCGPTKSGASANLNSILDGTYLASELPTLDLSMLIC